MRNYILEYIILGTILVLTLIEVIIQIIRFRRFVKEIDKREKEFNMKKKLDKELEEDILKRNVEKMLSEMSEEELNRHKMKLEDLESH